MTTYLALLRGINVGGHNKVSMAELRAFLAEIGFSDARTLLQSGNAIFRGKAQPVPALEVALEKEAAARLGLTCDFIVRTAAQWDALISANPFVDEARRDPAHLVVMCMRKPPSAAAVKALRAAIKGPETLHAEGANVYLHYPVDIGHSKLTNAVIEKHLGARGTARNWNTALKLAAAAADGDSGQYGRQAIRPGG